jgi:plasmid stabilization system protein ParE
MRVEYSKRAVADLRKIAAYHLASDNPDLAVAIAARVRAVVARIARSPESASPVRQRRGVRQALLLRFPYKVFYKVTGDTIRIVHRRHTAGRPWGQGR